MFTATVPKEDSHLRETLNRRGLATLMSRMMFSDWALPRECPCLFHPHLSCHDSPTWCPCALARDHQVLFVLTFELFIYYNIYYIPDVAVLPLAKILSDQNTSVLCHTPLSINQDNWNCCCVAGNWVIPIICTLFQSHNESFVCLCGLPVKVIIHVYFQVLLWGCWTSDSAPGMTVPLSLKTLLLQLSAQSSLKHVKLFWVIVILGKKKSHTEDRGIK